MKHLEGVGRSLIARFKKGFSKKTKKQFFVTLSVLGVVAIGILLINVHPIFAQTKTPDGFDEFLSWLARLAVSVAGVIGQLVVFILDSLTIPLMSYNGFSTSGVGCRLEYCTRCSQHVFCDRANCYCFWYDFWKFQVSVAATSSATFIVCNINQL